jgi:hypothetical protein
MTAMRRGFLTVAFVATLLGAATPALAGPESEAKATKLFEEGKRQRDANNFEAAIASFSESAKHHASFGAYFNLGLCNEALGKDRPAKLYEALEWYKKAQELAVRNNDARESDAKQAIAKLRESNNYVVVQVPHEVAQALGLRINVDGDVVPSERYNGDVFVKSAGDHDVVINAKGRKEQRLTAKNKQAITVVLGDPVSEALPPPPPPAETTGGGWGWQTWTGLGVGAAGLVTIAVAVVMHAGHLGTLSDLEGQRVTPCVDGDDKTPCPDKTAADGLETKIKTENERAGPLLGATYAVGGVLAITGIVLFLTAPSSSPDARSGSTPIRVRPFLGPQAGSLVLSGSF